jgi:hypothetical protein
MSASSQVSAESNQPVAMGGPKVDRQAGGYDFSIMSKETRAVYDEVHQRAEDETVNDTGGEFRRLKHRLANLYAADQMNDKITQEENARAKADANASGN